MWGLAGVSSAVQEDLLWIFSADDDNDVLITVIKNSKVSYMEADGKALIFSPSTPGVFVWFWFVSFSVFIYLFIFAEELQKQLLEQMELRKKLEREFQHLKGKLISATVHVKANVPPLCDWGQNISLNISNPPQQ